MIKQKESKQVRMDSSLLKLLSRKIKKKKNKNNRKIKNIRKVKAIGNITPTMDHYPRNG